MVLGPGLVLGPGAGALCTDPTVLTGPGSGSWQDLEPVGLSVRSCSGLWFSQLTCRRTCVWQTVSILGLWLAAEWKHNQKLLKFQCSRAEPEHWKQWKPVNDGIFFIVYHVGHVAQIANFLWHSPIPWQTYCQPLEGLERIQPLKHMRSNQKNIYMRPPKLKHNNLSRLSQLNKCRHNMHEIF